MMDHILIYAYTCIGLVGLAIVGMVVFTWVVLRKLRMVPRYFASLIFRGPDGVLLATLIVSFAWIRFRGVL
jgi:hypothetical protein